MRKVFVQDRQTEMFFRQADRWTRNIAEALDFRTSLNALAYCLQHGMNNAQVVVHFGIGDRKEIVVPVQKEEPNPIEAQPNAS